MATNPRYANGSLRRKNRARLRAMGCECAICQGRLGPIHYDEPSDYKHPLSFVVDERIPIAKYYLAYNSKEECANDFNNLQSAHYICNQKKRDKLNFSLVPRNKKKNEIDGQW